MLLHAAGMPWLSLEHSATHVPNVAAGCFVLHSLSNDSAYGALAILKDDLRCVDKDCYLSKMVLRAVVVVH